VKAFVVPARETTGDDALARDLIAHCHQHLLKWAVPRSIEFRASLPTTLVGKVAYTQLELQERERTDGAG
jgi:acyl-coenzyme A synthetase/AMP-(fatty) acid ligase